MKTRSRSLLTLLCAASASLLMIGPSAQAGYIVALTQVGSNVVATGSGLIDLTGLSFFSDGLQTGVGINPSIGGISTGPTSLTLISLYTGISGPTSFGSGGGTAASSGSGDVVGMERAEPGDFFVLVVPRGYTSNSPPLSDSSTYDGETFSSLGVTPGIFEWTWGTGPNQNFTIKIGTAAVPESDSTLGLLLIGLTCLSGVIRFRSSQLA
jgi:hypothetical protein